MYRLSGATVMEKPRLLITGASGFLGPYLCRAASQKYHVFGISHKNRIPVENIQSVSADLCNEGSLVKIFNQVKPEAVIHAAAMAMPNQCQDSPSQSQKINVSTSLSIAAICRDRALPMVFISTDLVFDGKKGNYSETDPVSPVSLYGEQKVRAESGILDRLPDALICRMPLMFGDACGCGQSFIQPMVRAFRNSEVLNLFTDEFRTPVSGACAAKGVLLALEKNAGIMHLGGKERISRYDFGVRLAETGDFNKHLIVPKRQKEIKFSAPRPADVSLDSAKAFALGYAPADIRTALSCLDCLSRQHTKNQSSKDR